MVIVFGSSARGVHSSGAALYARRFFGAKNGIGEGPRGRSYAIPVRHNSEFLPLYVIKAAAERFCHYAIRHPRTLFRVTRVGVGSQYTDEQMAQLFANPPKNCTFDPRWKEFGLPIWDKPQRGTLPDR